MVFLFIIFVLSIFYKFNTTKLSIFHDDYLGRAQTTCIKGIFAVIILFSHIRTYVELDNNILDKIYNFSLSLIGQLMVTIFLFYSGYGILESYKQNKGYSRTFFRNRIIKTLIHFDLAVLLYLAVNTILGIKYESLNYILCWIGWKSIGNSKWFIFDILALYLLTLLAFNLTKFLAKDGEKIKTLLTIICTGTIILVVFLYITKSNEGSWWYDTLLTYPFGMLYSYYKEAIDKKLKEKGWALTVLITLVLFIVFYKINSFVAYNICGCAFVLFITCFTMRIKVVNPILEWLGKHSFSIYIIQRLPMIILSHFGINDRRYLFAVLSIVCALMLAGVFQKLLSVVDKKLLHKV